MSPHLYYCAVVLINYIVFTLFLVEHAFPNQCVGTTKTSYSCAENSIKFIDSILFDKGNLIQVKGKNIIIVIQKYMQRNKMHEAQYLHFLLKLNNIIISNNVMDNLSPVNPFSQRLSYDE